MPDGQQPNTTWRVVGVCSPRTGEGNALALQRPVDNLPCWPPLHPPEKR